MGTTTHLTALALANTSQFADTTGCRHWLSGLPLTNVMHARDLIQGQLSRLSNLPSIAPVERFRMLEALLEAVLFVQNESSKRYAGKPLPMDRAEADAWQGVVALWQDLASNYAHCIQSYRQGDLHIAPHIATIMHRALRTQGALFHEHYRAYRQPPGTLWHELHDLYLMAEQHGFARIRVVDTFAHHEQDSSCVEAYLQAVLLHQANPYALSIRQASFVQRWLEKWAALVGLASQPLPPSPIPALVVDLASHCGAALLNADDTDVQSVRHLDLEQLSKTLRQTINLLKQGKTPAQLGLGDDARQPGCENLLMLLYVQWCRAGSARLEARSETAEDARVCFGLNAAHVQLNGGRPFRQPGELTAREKRELDTFGYIARISHEVLAPDQGGAEPWHILNHSASGFMCMHRPRDGAVRIAHNQLIAVRRDSSKQFYLGVVQWLRMEEADDMYCGVRLFPGAPRVISARPSNFNPSTGTRFEQALLLPEVPAPATPATIILPAGWFQSGRFVEIVSDRKQVARLGNLLEKGADFDRGTITIV